MGKIELINRIIKLSPLSTGELTSLSAKKLIEQASIAKADFVKFQTFSAKNLTTQKGELAEYQQKQVGSYKNQFEMLMIYSGMLQDGVSSEGAIAFIMLMGETPTDIAWLIKKVGATKKSELYKDADRKLQAKNALNNVLLGT